MMRTLRPLVFVALTALSSAAGCASSSSQDDATTGDDANLTKVAISDVKLESAPVTFGASRKYVASPKEKARIHAVPFEGNAGDVVNAESHSKWAGTLYVLKKVGATYAVVSSAKADAKKVGKVNVTLRTAGTFFIGFEASPTKTTAKTAVATVTLKLDGTAQPTDGSFVSKLKALYESVDGGEGQFVAIDEKDLPAAAKKEWNQLNKDFGPDYAPLAYEWMIDGKKVYVVENSNDGGMSISFYDERGNYIVGGSAGESTPFYWG